MCKMYTHPGARLVYECFLNADVSPKAPCIFLNMQN